MDPDLVDADFVNFREKAVLTESSKTSGSLHGRANGATEPDYGGSLRQLHEEVLSQLRRVQDPDLGRDVVALGFVRDLKVGEEKEGGRDVSLCLRLTTPACPFKGQLQQEAVSMVQQLPWAKQVTVSLDSVRNTQASAPGRPPNLRRVEFIVGVASCKGGSGKSTVALALALMLRRSGAKVGLLDADIYGPSLPTLLQVEGVRARFAEEKAIKKDREDVPEPSFFQVQTFRKGRPATRRARIEYEMPAPQPAPKENQEEATEGANMALSPVVVAGIKCMSYGFITKKNEQGYSALRGPFVSSVAEQLLTGTRWGALDYLLIDLPPGTGDIHITLTQQQVPLDGCVVITTPQVLSLVDAEKGLRMLKGLSIPCLSLVCNMAYFICDSCDKRHELYGHPDAAQQLAELSAAHQLVLLPFDSRLNATSFSGSPSPDARDSFVDRLGPEDSVWTALRSLADRVACELSVRRFGSLKPQASVVPDGSAVLVTFLSAEGAPMGEGLPLLVKEAFEIPGEILRLRCGCSSCVAARSVGQQLKPAINEVVVGKLIETQDRRVEITWGDGHESQFAVSELADLCRQLRQATAEGGSSCNADPELEW